MNLLLDHAPSIGLVGFFIAFLWIVFQAYRPSAKRRMEDHANIPFKEQ